MYIWKYKPPGRKYLKNRQQIFENLSIFSNKIAYFFQILEKFLLNARKFKGCFRQKKIGTGRSVKILRG